MSLSVVRQELKTRLEAAELLGSLLFEVWINEDAPPAPGTEDSWEHCMGQVDAADLVLALYNGNSGWARDGGELGICHGEFQQALSHAPGKLLSVQLPLAPERKNPTERARDLRFREYVDRQNLFRGAVAETGEEVIDRCLIAVRQTVARLARLGVDRSSKGQGYAADALTWSRFSFAERRAAIEAALRSALAERDGSTTHDGQILVRLQDTQILIVCHGIPASLAVPAARELVGQPFLLDHQFAAFLEHGIGPVHLVGCSESVSKTQAMKILGFPDAMIVDSPFGVYVASDIQKIQLIFLRHCSDESATRSGVQRLFEWLEQWGEAPHLKLRAQQRAEVVRVLARVNQTQAGPRKQAARAGRVVALRPRKNA